MTEPLGNPPQYWARAENAGSRPPRGPVPDLTGFAAFDARVRRRDPRWQVPLLLLGLAAFCAWYSTESSTGFLDLAPQTRQTVLLAQAGLISAAAVAVLLWDILTRTGVARRAHDAFIEDGFVAEAYRTSLNVSNGESFQPAWVLIDTRIDAEQADRLYAAYDEWLQMLGANEDLREAAAAGMQVSRGPVRSETVFGPEAAGGYMTGPMSSVHWVALIPKGRSWRVCPIRDIDRYNPLIPIG